MRTGFGRLLENAGGGSDGELAGVSRSRQGPGALLAGVAESLFSILPNRPKLQ